MVISKNATFDSFRKVKVNGYENVEFEFTNGFHRHNSGFVHYSILYMWQNGHRTQLSEAKVCYINRTWECFRYQTAMYAAAYKVHDPILRQLIRQEIHKMAS